MAGYKVASDRVVKFLPVAKQLAPHVELYTMPESPHYPKYKPPEATHPDDSLGDGCIRLVRLSETSSTGRVECQTKQFALDDTPEYTALSYACGPRPADNVIRLNGRDWYIRKNLLHFLVQYVRTLPEGTAKSDWLWIDAICINQTNKDERAHQVKLMAEIYKKASCVLIWLGPAEDNSDAAMDEISKPQLDRSGSDKALWSLALVALCERDYWRRLWVLQELKVAKTRRLMCGRHVVQWEQFESTVRLAADSNSALAALEQYSKHIPNSSATRMLELIRKPMETRLYDILDATSHLQCEEKLDKVYALLGFVTLEVDIEPDYTIPLSVLINKVLKSDHALVPPVTLSGVASQCDKLDRLFGSADQSIFFVVDPTDGSDLQSAANDYTQSLEFHPPFPGMTLSWASRYQHSKVHQLLLLRLALSKDCFWILLTTFYLALNLLLSLAFILPLYLTGNWVALIPISALLAIMFPLCIIMWTKETAPTLIAFTFLESEPRHALGRFVYAAIWWAIRTRQCLLNIAWELPFIRRSMSSRFPLPITEEDWTNDLLLELHKNADLLASSRKKRLRIYLLMQGTDFD